MAKEVHRGTELKIGKREKGGERLQGGKGEGGSLTPRQANNTVDITRDNSRKELIIELQIGEAERSKEKRNNVRQGICLHRGSGLT